MKKLFAMILILVCMTAFAAAETDLSSMSYDELVELQKDLVFEIMSRPEWKQVTVPAGMWRVGDDIPAGTYSITPVKQQVGVQVWRKQKDDYSNDGLYYNKVLQADQPCGKIILKTGMLVEVSKEVIFAPPLMPQF